MKKNALFLGILLLTITCVISCAANKQLPKPKSKTTKWMPEFGTVAGKVLSYTCEMAAPGIEIVIAEIRYGDYSDEDGFFRIEDVPPGVYTLYAMQRDSIRQEVCNVEVRAGRTTEVGFLIYVPEDRLFLPLPKETQMPAPKGIGKITGKVTNKDGVPLQGAAVSLLETAKGALTDSEGDYFILNVPVGKYTLLCTLIGFEETRVPDVYVTQDLTVTVNIKLDEDSK